MNITRISADFSTGAQIAPADVATLAAKGFSAIVCNRPDNEQPGQPDAEMIRRAAAEAGLAFHHIPVVPGRAGRAEVEAMANALRSAAGPVFAYCRSGARAASLYHAARATAA